MSLAVGIYKEKKSTDFRMVILPSGRNRIGLTQEKDYGIVSYLNKKDSQKIGEFILWALTECDREVIENTAKVKWGKKHFNLNGDTKVLAEYNCIDLDYYNNEYKLSLLMKDGYGFTSFEDKEGNKYRYIFKEKPTSKELGLKVMEMFEFKEKYDEGIYLKR